MSWKRAALIPSLVAVVSLGLAGCGSANGPAGPTAGPEAAPGPSRTLTVGVTDGHLGDAVTDTSGGRLRELSTGGPVDPSILPSTPGARNGVGAGDACANAALQPDSANLATVAAATLCLLNGERADRGLATLRPNERLRRAALGHGGDMVAHGYFSHSGRDGSQPAQRIRAAGYLSSGGSWRIGENLAWGTGTLATPTAIMAAWMSSTGHRANILQPAYREIGFGLVAGNPASRTGAGATFVTEFGVVAKSQRTASQRVVRVVSQRRSVRRAATRRAATRRAATRRARARSRARRARARRARAALAPRSRRGRIVGSVASARGGLG
jgi:uncharacterized protein YkwD